MNADNKAMIIKFEKPVCPPKRWENQCGKTDQITVDNVEKLHDSYRLEIDGHADAWYLPCEVVSRIVR